MFDALHHVAIIVSDYQVSRRFYVEKLGLPIVRENYRPERGDWKLDLRVGAVELEIFSNPSAPERPTYPEARPSGLPGGGRGRRRGRAGTAGHSLRAHPHRPLYRRAHDLLSRSGRPAAGIA